MSIHLLLRFLHSLLESVPLFKRYMRLFCIHLIDIIIIAFIMQVYIRLNGSKIHEIATPVCIILLDYQQTCNQVTGAFRYHSFYTKLLLQYSYSFNISLIQNIAQNNNYQRECQIQIQNFNYHICNSNYQTMKITMKNQPPLQQNFPQNKKIIINRLSSNTTNGFNPQDYIQTQINKRANQIVRIRSSQETSYQFPSQHFFQLNRLQLTKEQRKQRYSTKQSTPPQTFFQRSSLINTYQEGHHEIERMFSKFQQFYQVKHQSVYRQPPEKKIFRSLAQQLYNLKGRQKKKRGETKMTIFEGTFQKDFNENCSLKKQGYPLEHTACFGINNPKDQFFQYKIPSQFNIQSQPLQNQYSLYSSINPQTIEQPANLNKVRSNTQSNTIGLEYPLQLKPKYVKQKEKMLEPERDTSNLHLQFNKATERNFMLSSWFPTNEWKEIGPQPNISHSNRPHSHSYRYLRNCPRTYTEEDSRSRNPGFIRKQSSHSDLLEQCRKKNEVSDDRLKLIRQQLNEIYNNRKQKSLEKNSGNGYLISMDIYRKSANSSISLHGDRREKDKKIINLQNSRSKNVLLEGSKNNQLPRQVNKGYFQSKFVGNGRKETDNFQHYNHRLLLEKSKRY